MGSIDPKYLELKNLQDSVPSMTKDTFEMVMNAGRWLVERRLVAIEYLKATTPEQKEYLLEMLRRYNEQIRAYFAL